MAKTEIYSWPPVMYNPSDDLKRCVGHVDMDSRTLRSRLLELGINPEQRYIKTVDLIEAIDGFNRKICKLTVRPVHSTFRDRLSS